MFIIGTSGDVDFLFSDPPYADFVSYVTTETSGREVINVEAYFGRIPIMQGSCLFDSGQAWSLFYDNDDFFLVFRRLGSDMPYMVARFDHDVVNVELYCSDDLLNRERKADNLIHYPLDQILLMLYLSSRKGAIVHAAGLSLYGKGCLFPGCSGAGKSTISRLFASRDYSVLSDDRVVVRKIGDAFRVFGTPWPGDAGIAENRALPLHSMFFIVHGEENRVEKLSPKEAFERLMPVTSIPWYDEKVLPSMLSFCEDIAMNIPAYDLYFRPEDEVVSLLESLSPTLHKGEGGHA